ncbi:immunoglobulin-like domain-containing protein [Paraclostridium sordellii]|uniref:immunoglobulin-like domain-containing protein n=1 Tax=Paraclostridium sordellii TaxID=1505 RepID=UPI0005410AD0|nr:immunoglobulin-like domain-containing protein [Paeniclostridium sordellii]AUO31779.1 hypothetical protein [Paeniclostridium sordellii]CEK40127.1 hypothetical protein JGS6382_PCS1300861 (plasmid) [[Clostridium] sordellii] [Paeniclostridium sordellii]
MNKKNKQAKKALVGAITTTMIIQSIPLNIFANEEDNKTIESKLETPKEDVEKKDEKIESTKLDTDINPDSDINKDDTKQNGEEKNEELNKVQPKQEGDSEIKEKTIVQDKNSDVVNIPDVNLENKLRTILKLSADQPITKGDLSTINYLSLKESRIKNISGLEYCTNLKTLDLGNDNILNNNMSNQISDISPLAGLTNLTTLSLRGNFKVSDISPLAGLTNLTNLSLEYNQISDISPLAGLTNLTTLFLWHNQISDISPLASLTNLTNLALSENQISDISPLASLTNLTKLQLFQNQISDISPLASLTKTSLYTLGLSSNQISDISPLKNLNISNLDLRYQKIQLKEVDSKNNIAEVENSIKNRDGSSVNVVNISNGGIYNPDTNLIKWDNITSDVNETYDFSVNLPNSYGKFSGKVTQPIKYSNEKPVITANNVNIKANSPINLLTDKAIGLKATDKEDGNITDRVTVKSDGGLNVKDPKVGTYTVVYTVTDDDGNTTDKSITVIVRSNDKPSINGVDKVSIKEGTPFNPMAGVTATDTEDGNITKDIKVTGTVDIDKPGKYELTYTVTDTDGNTTTVKRIVIVNMKWVDINNIPVIKAEDKTIKVGDKFNPMTGVTATDKEDGNITKDIKVIEDTVNTSKPGTYKVVYEVTDSKGAKTTKTITVTVRSNDKPVISGADNVSIKEGTTFNPMAGVTATDTEDGNITKDIKVTGTVDIDKPGKYELTYTVTDTDGNTTTVKRTVIVNMKWVDINNIPVIKAEDKTIKVGDKFNPMTGVTATDKEDGNTTKDIKVIEDTVNTSKPGTYKVVYEVTDSKGATATKTITVTVRSNDKPVISGADNVSIKEGTTFNPMTGVTATDTEDGNITKDIKVTGTVDTDKPGKYELTYTVTDTDGNTTTVKRIITVNPKIVVINSMPVIKAEDKTVKVGDKFNPMTGVTATDKEDGNITKDIKVIENTVDTSKPGTYKVVYEVTDSQGAKTTKTITVNVINGNIENSTINNNSSSETKPPGNTNDIDGNNETTTKKTNNLQQNNQVVSSNNLNPQTGDTGVLGYLGVGLAALTGLFINRKNKNKDR